MGEINFFYREMDTYSTISIPRDDQCSLPEGDVEEFWLICWYLLSCTTFRNNILRVEFGANIDESWRILFAWFFFFFQHVELDIKISELFAKIVPFFCVSLFLKTNNEENIKIE